MDSVVKHAAYYGGALKKVLGDYVNGILPKM
jgi:hypothetical protein